MSFCCHCLSGLMLISAVLFHVCLVLLLLPVGFPSNDNGSRKSPPLSSEIPGVRVCALGLHRGSQHHAVHGHIHLLQGLVLQSPPIGPHLGHTWVTPGSHLGHTWATPGSHLGHTWVTPWTQDALNIFIFILNVMFLCSGRSTSHNNNPTASSCGWACSAGLHWDPRVVWAAWARRGESEYHTPSDIEQVMGGGS